MRAALPGGSAGSASAFTSRYSDDLDGSFTRPLPWVCATICSASSITCRMVVLLRPRHRRSASSTAATTRSSVRPVGDGPRRWRLSTSPHNPCLP
ncbi:hypothetical protein ACIA8M_36720 [Streptomyces anulatus]